MFGIGGGELVFIIFIALMLFGADKIPDIARTMGKIMRQVKDATDDIKYEITKSAESNDIDLNSLDRAILKERNKAKVICLGNHFSFSFRTFFCCILYSK